MTCGNRRLTAYYVTAQVFCEKDAEQRVSTGVF